MQRDIFNELKTWHSNPNRKPLLLMGARQVGKTYTLKAFGEQEYTNCVYCNFETEPSLKQLFAENIDPTQIIKLLSIAKNTTIEPEKTLIIFDEVQECPEALNSLKYFCELAKAYPICAAGSLLGVTLAHTKGFPVGKVEFLHLYPLSFTEFLQALEQDQLKNYLTEINTITPLPEILHKKLLQYFKYYLFVGGMPEAVEEYAKTENLLSVRNIQQNIVTAYRLDFAKHAPPNYLMRINQVWGNIPSQLAKENKKFIYSMIREGARAKEFEIAIQWLTEAGLLYKATHVSTAKLPLSAYAEFNFFKLYLLDVGLLGAMAQIEASAVIYGETLFQELRGAITENYVAQVLMKNNYPIYYWASEGRAEVDFVIQQQQHIYPLEVKFGESKQKKSLQAYAAKFQPALLLRASTMNLKRDGDVLNIPLYCLAYLSELLKMVLH